MLNNKIVLIGGGGHCKSVIDTLVRMGCYSKIMVTDKDISSGEKILGCPVVGRDEILPRLFECDYQKAFITVGSIKSTEIRRRIYGEARSIGFSFPLIVDPSAIIAESAVISQGVFIGKNAVVNADVKLDDFSIINTGAIIEHECHIGQFTHISVGAVVCGNVEIESDVFIGANATIIQGIKIGMNSVIGAGSVVLADVPENSSVVGVWKAV